MTYGNEELFVADDGLTINCPRKQVKVLLHLLQKFMVTKKKMVVGFSTDPYIPEDRFHCWAWEDRDYVYIGCLKESKTSFAEKYVELIKSLKNRTDEQKCREGSRETKIQQDS